MTGLAGLTAIPGCVSDDLRADTCSETTLQLDAASTAHVSNEFSTPLDGVAYAGSAAVETAIEDGEATARGYYTPGLPTRYVVTDSPEYYRVETETIDSVSVPGYAYSVSVDSAEPGGSSAPAGIPFSGLPDRDRDAIRSALGNPSLIHAPHYPPFEVTFAYESAELRDRSEFIPAADGVSVEWDGELLRFAFEGERSVDVTTRAVRATRVAAAPNAFVQFVVDEHGRSIEDPTEERRAILEEAIESEYGECEPYSDAFAELLETLTVDGGTIAPVVGYDGVYFTHLAGPG